MNDKDIINQILYSTIRIEAIFDENKISVGTGFIVLYQKEDKDYLFITTNKHVVYDKNFGFAKKGRFFLHKKDSTNHPIVGDKKECDLIDFDKFWTENKSGEDVVVGNFQIYLSQIGEEIYFKSIPLNIIPSTEQKNNFSALEDIVFVGYPNGIYDNYNNLPILRKGTSATPIFIDYEHKPHFLIDAFIYPGSSGSPVFIYYANGYREGENIFIGGSKLYFVGIVSSVLTNIKDNFIEFTEIPTGKLLSFKSDNFLNLGLVIKSNIILDTIEDILNIKVETEK